MTVDGWKERIHLAQFPLYAGETKPRIKWTGSTPCPDCSCEQGQYHVPGCDQERCPSCGGQCISCDCAGKEEADEE